MNLSHAYVDHVMARLSALAEVSYRRIFNGVGIYFDGAQFALIVNNKLYFRADEQSRHLYLQRKMPAFQPPRRRSGGILLFPITGCGTARACRVAVLVAYSAGGCQCRPVPG